MSGSIRDETIRELARQCGLSAHLEDVEDFAAKLAEEIAACIEAHLYEPQVITVGKIDDTPRDVAIRDCAAIARMIGKP